MMNQVKPKNIDEYISAAPSEEQKNLLFIRNLINELVPGAVEKSKWGLPVFEEKRILFSLAA